MVAPGIIKAAALPLSPFTFAGDRLSAVLNSIQSGPFLLTPSVFEQAAQPPCSLVHSPFVFGQSLSQQPQPQLPSKSACLVSVRAGSRALCVRACGRCLVSLFVCNFSFLFFAVDVLLLLCFSPGSILCGPMCCFSDIVIPRHSHLKTCLPPYTLIRFCFAVTPNPIYLLIVVLYSS